MNVHPNPGKYTIDSRLVRNIQSGDEEAFRELYDRFAERIFYFSLRYVKNREDAEGVTQDIFLKIWENRQTLNPDLSLNAYIFTITKNTLFNKNRKRINEQAYLEYLKRHLDRCYDKTENDILLNEVKNCIDLAMEQLPEKRRRIFQMSRFECLSYQEISTRLNISVRTVETHLRLAMKSVRAYLERNLKVVIPILAGLLQHW